MTRHARPWKVISTRSLFEDDRITVLEDVVELPDGTSATYVYTPSSEDSVIVIAVNEDDEILVQQEYSHPPKKVMWQLPGGSMLPGETVIAAARRELAEESGFGAKSAKIIGKFYVNNRKSNKIQHIVLCTQLFKRKLPSDPDEFIDTFWISRAELQQMIASNKVDNINLLATIGLWSAKQEQGSKGLLE